MQTSMDNNRERELTATKPGRRGACDQVWSRLLWDFSILVMGALVAFCSVVKAAADELAVAVQAADVTVLDGDVAAPVRKQWRVPFEPMLKVELSFANRVCKLTDDQRRNLIAKSDAWLDTFVANYVKQGGQPQPVGVWIAGGRRQTADPRESVQKGVAKLIASELPKEQAEKYAEEDRKRTEFKKQAFVENLVTRIDSELLLSPEQRDKISKSLTEHWDKNWQPQAEMFVIGISMRPAVPDQWIRPHLSPVQQIAWGRLNKNHGPTLFGGVGFGLDGQVIDDIDLKEGQEKMDTTTAEADTPREPRRP